MKVFLRILVCFVLTAACLTATRPISAQPQPAEYEVKAAFLYNFLPFVEWPATSKRTDKLRVCVMADPPVLTAFNELDGQVASGRKIDLVHLAPDDNPRSCHVLFIGPRAEGDLPAIMKALGGASVLTVADTAGLDRQGVIINFYLQDKKVRFEINATAARKAGIVISSRLLKLAGAVLDASAEGE